MIGEWRMENGEWDLHGKTYLLDQPKLLKYA
jgi:hypothetical protein